MSERLDCKAVADEIKAQCAKKAAALKARDIRPKLGILRVGEKGPDLSYEKGILSFMREIGIAVEVVALPAEVSQERYVGEMQKLNADASVHGILALRPLDHIEEETAISDCLCTEKDVDAATTKNLGRIMAGDKRGFLPCTAAALLSVLDYYEISLDGKDVVLINRSNVIGKPLSMMLLQRNATVTICHTHTEGLPEKCRQADILILGLNGTDLITEDFVTPHTVLLDATTVWQKVFDEAGNPVLNEKTGRQRVRTRGCCTEAALDACAAFTPVPGIGGITTALLAKNVLQACCLQNESRLQEKA